MAGILSNASKDYLQEITKETDPLLLEMEDFALKNNIPILERISAKFLEQILQVKSPKTFLEIGMAIGYSTIRVAKILHNQTIIDTIELSKDNIKIANSFIHKANLDKRINILYGDAKEILINSSLKYDFIFLDADKEDYDELFDLSIDHLNPNGIIFIDNLLWKGFVGSEIVPEKYKKSTELINKFNAKFLSSPNLISTILPIGDGIGLGIKLN